MPGYAKPVLGGTASDTVDRVETVDARTLVLMRCALALSAWAIILIDPSEPKRLVGLTYASLALYSIYSAALIYSSYRADWAAQERAIHWVDVVFYACLLVLTEGTSNIFFYFFFFAILVASFSWGFREGLAVTLASFALYTTVGLTVAPAGDASELQHTLAHATYLFVFGCMISYWGGYERLLKRRLKFLREISNLWNPRFGADHAIGLNLERLLEFYEASSCILVLRRPTTPPSFVMYSALPQRPGHSKVPLEITKETADALIRLPQAFAAAYLNRPRSWLGPKRTYIAYDIGTRLRKDELIDACENLANLLDAQGFVTVPYTQRDGTTGRIYVTSKTRAFNKSDVDFLVQASATMSTVVENMTLMEELISRAAEYERSQISRDMHDTTIQPYIGLKLGLEALQREVLAGCPLIQDAPQRAAAADCPLPREIFELIDMTGTTIREFRDYAEVLRNKTPMPGESLVSAVKKQAERLGRFYGIDVEVKSDISAHMNGHIAAEAFQIVSEGLSNILRHTPAKSAYVSILCENLNLQLRVGNESRNGPVGMDEFTPRSIQERVQALGGTTLVEQGLDGFTVVHVTIPM